MREKQTEFDLTVGMRWSVVWLQRVGRKRGQSTIIYASLLGRICELHLLRLQLPHSDSSHTRSISGLEV